MLDRALDRLWSAGYVDWRFEGRHLTATHEGRAALARAFAGGQQHGRLLTASDLYPFALRTVM